MTTGEADARSRLLKDRPVLVDLFAGVGGLALGLEWAGFFSALHVEVEETTARYAAYNFPLCSHFGCHARGDIREIESKTIEEAVGRREIALIAGGPPCQGFSNAGRRVVDDPLNDLVLEMARIVGELKPKAFLIENVPGIRSGQYWQLEMAIEKLASGYQISAPTVLAATDFGVPQLRKRVFIIGLRSDLGATPSLPIPTHGSGTSGETLFPLASTPTVGDAIMDVPDCDEFDHLLDGDEVPYKTDPHSEFAALMRTGTDFDRRRGYRVEWDPSICSGLRRTKHGPDLALRLAMLKPGRTDAKSRIRRLELDEPSTTIRAGTTADRGAWSAPRPCHPILPRVLSSRECARLQTFPDWFRFHPAKWHANRQIGNAVPPMLALAVGNRIMTDLGSKPIMEEPISVRRDLSLIESDLKAALNAGLGRKKTTHQVVGTDAESRRKMDAEME